MSEQRLQGVFYHEDTVKQFPECCNKCSDVTFDKTYPMHTAYYACINLRCECHAGQAPQSDNTLDDYNKRVVENVSMCADSDIPAEWTNTLTGKKLYNQASVDIAIAEARINEVVLVQDQILKGNQPYRYTRKRIAELDTLQAQRDKLISEGEQS